MFRKLLNGVIHLCWYSIAGAIITLAVAITLLRFLLPDIGNYREDVQLFVSEYTGYPVEIKELDATWDGWIPNLYLKDISILDKDKKQTIVNFEEAHVELDPITSLQERSLIPLQLKVSGLDLSFSRLEDGSIIIVESGTNLFGDENQFDQQGLTDWLRQQKNILIENANLSWVDQQQRFEPIRFNNASIELNSSLDELKANGTASLTQKSGNANIQYQVDIFGDILSSDWSGTVNLNGYKLELGEWLNKLLPEHLTVQETSGNIKLKSKFKYAKLNQLVADIEYDDFSLTGNPAPLHFRNIKAEVDLLRTHDQTWLLDLKMDDLITQNGIWESPSSRIEINRSKDWSESSVHASFDKLKHEDLISIARQFPNKINQDYLHLIKQGQFNQLEVTYDRNINQSYPFSIKTDLNNFELSYHDNTRLSGLNGQLYHDGNQGRLHIQPGEARFVAPELYSQPIQLKNINGDLSWSLADSDNKISIEQFQITTKDIPLLINGEILLNDTNDPKLNIITTSENFDLNKLATHFPLTVNPDVIDWLSMALTEGHVESVETIIKGPLSKFPYDEKDSGQFKVTAKVNDATLLYDDEWPAIKEVNADLLIESRQLTVSSNKGKFFNANINKVKAIVPNLTNGKPILDVKGNVKGDSQDLLAYIDESPLKENDALQTPKKINLKGPIDLDIDLMIPLTTGPLIQVNGKANLLGNSIDAESTGIQLQGLKGQINFTRDKVEADKLTAKYFDHEISLKIKDAADHKQKVILTGNMDREFIKKQFQHYFPSNTDLINDYLDQIKGQSQWQAEVNLVEDASYGKKLTVSSNLNGIEIDLPKPLTKSKHETLPVTLSTTLSDNQQQQDLDLQFGNLLAAKLGFSSSDDTKLESLNIDFSGRLNTLTNKQGAFLTGQLDQLELSEWLKLIQKKTHQGIEKETSIYDDLQVDLKIAQLELFKQQFNDVKLAIDKPEKDWNILVHSNDIEGTITIPLDTTAIVLNLSKLKLNPPENKDNESLDIDPNKLPSIHAYASEFHFGDKKLGEMYLETSRIEHGLSFDHISFSKDKINISAHGQWTKTGHNNESSFNIDLDAEELNAMLDTFNYGLTSIENGKTDINIEAAWSGTPMDFQLENLNGAMSLIIDKGQILNINPKAGRLFGLLSLQSLPRRLSLDFSDLFGEGLSFDRIDGSFTLENGNAYTNNLLMNGPSANIAITGRTGLIEQDYDQLVTVTPQIADTLPVASALFGPIGVGVGAVIYFAGELFDSIPSNIDKILQYQYTITGSWNDPKVEKYGEEINNEEASG